MTEFLLSEPVWAYPALMLLSFLAGSVLPLGSEWLFIWLQSQGYDLLTLIIVATLGNSLGGFLTLWFGRKGRDLYGNNHQPGRRWLYAERLFRRYGSWSLLLSWVPVVGDLLVVMAGIARVPALRACVLILVGKAARYTVLGLIWMGAVT